MSRLAILMAAGGLMLGACAPMPGADNPAPPTDAPDQCKASQYRSYIGRNRSTLPPKPEGETWRVVCTTCAMTMDYNPTRLNIVYEERTGIIRQVNCG